MDERKEVEALLQRAEDYVGHWPPTPDRKILAALCRAWLAVDESPVMQIGGADGLSAFLIRHEKPTHRELQGQRVRIVPEPPHDP